MKLAILGSHSLALETAVRFHVHGAAVTWFRDSQESDFLPLSSDLSWENTTTDNGWELLGKTKITTGFSPEAWTTFYRDPLIDIIRSEQEFKPYKVLSISKRFLAPRETITGKDRFYDLFRIIYQLNPTEFVERQKENDPAMYERLSTEMMESLQSTLEMYDDFDLVVDLRPAREVISINENGRALGESRVSQDKVSKGTRILSELNEITNNKDIREMILIGSGEVAIEALLGLRDWVLNPVNRLFVATAEEVPFEKFLQTASQQVKEKFDHFMAVIQTHWENEMNIFHEKLREWQALDDFVQAKKPRPAEPIPQVNFFSGHNVTAIDQLIDRKRLFLTLEKPDFREGKWQPENNILDLKTLGVDHVLVATRMKREDIVALDDNEKGYFSHQPTSANVDQHWEKDLAALKGIENEVFKLFSLAGTH